MREPEAFAAAKVKFASEAIVADLLAKYRERLFSKHVYRNLRWFGPSNEDFEKAVFEKNSPYLNLLLSQSVTSPDVALLLWKWADQSPELSEDVGSAVKETLLLGPAAAAVLIETSNNNTNESGQIGILECLSKDDLRPLLMVMQNPWLKGFIGKVLLKEGKFEVIDDDLYPRLIRYLAANPAINFDDATVHGPDFEFRDLNMGIQKWMNEAPATEEWYKSLSELVDRMQPEVFRFNHFSIFNFVDKWKNFDSKEDLLEPGHTKMRASGDVLIYAVAAKFGDELLKGKKIKLDVALKMDMSAEKAAFFGRTWFNEKELKKIMNGAGMDVYSALHLNPVALRFASFRKHQYELLGSDFVDDSRLKFLAEKYPQDFIGEFSATDRGNEVAALARVLDSHILKLQEKLNENTRILWLIGAALLFVASKA